VTMKSSGAGREPRQYGLRDAYELSVLSLVASFIAILMGAISSVQTRSATALGYCLENAVDFLGSVLVLWRFAGNVSKEVLDSREQRADAGISMMFIVLGIVVGIDGVKDLLYRDKDRDVVELIALYAPSLVVFVLLGCAKIHVGRAVKSSSLRKDGMCSLAGALLSAGVLLSAVIEELTPIWWIDSLVAVIVAMGLASKGAHSLTLFARKGLRFWTADFWRGDDALAAASSASSRPSVLEEDPLLEDSRTF